MIQSTQSRDTVRQGGSAPVLWLVRHGESTWNVRGLAQGHDDQARLTEHGRRQAWRIVGQLSPQPIRALYSSDLHRALETVAPLASVLRLAVTRDARLRERCLGVAEGTAVAAISPAVSGISAQRVVDPDARPAGGESLRDFYQRVACFTADLAARHPGAGADAEVGPGVGAGAGAGAGTGVGQAGDVAIIAHGGTLRMLDACLRGIPVEQMAWAPLANGRILRSPAAWPVQLTHP
jgi:2,3-bisphosphoglycerate-dependent phosphoglycerate mutase